MRPPRQQKGEALKKSMLRWGKQLREVIPPWDHTVLALCAMWNFVNVLGYIVLKDLSSVLLHLFGTFVNIGIIVLGVHLNRKKSRLEEEARLNREKAEEFRRQARDQAQQQRHYRYSGVTYVLGRTWPKTLGVSSACTIKEMEKAYKMLALKHHPDRGGSEKMMSKINAARDDARRDLG